MYAHRAARLGARDREIDVFAIEALFSTVTNVNFDPEHLKALIDRAAATRTRRGSSMKAPCAKSGKTPETLGGPAAIAARARYRRSRRSGPRDIDSRAQPKLGADVTGLQELVIYGLKGAAAYADHAQILGKEDADLYASFHEVLDFLAKEKPTVDELLGWALQDGRDEPQGDGDCSTPRTPAPTAIPSRRRSASRRSRARRIVVSGHDLKDLEELLKQTEGKGINVYTHGEMLPAHGYPGLKKYKHLVGNYGGAWQDQQQGVRRLPRRHPHDDQLHPEAARELQGAHLHERPRRLARRDAHRPEARLRPGDRGGPRRARLPRRRAGARRSRSASASNAVMSVAGTVIDAVKAGKIRHFFLIGGCDGAKPGRNYYTEFAEAVPDDCVILTLACGKYRFNKLEFGDIGGIPRLLDIGQCNDAYSAVQIAVALREGVRGRRERAAALAGPLLVRAEGGRDPADAALSRDARTSGSDRACRPS